MERLTGNALTLSDGTKLYDINKNCETCAVVCNEHETCGECPVQAAFNKLAAYEDTWLEPEEITTGGMKVKQVIRERFKELELTMQEIPAGFDKLNTAAAMDELIGIYSRIFGISYDEAAEVLHKNEEDKP